MDRSKLLSVSQIRSQRNRYINMLEYSLPRVSLCWREMRFNCFYRLTLTSFISSLESRKMVSRCLFPIKYIIVTFLWELTSTRIMISLLIQIMLCDLKTSFWYLIVSFSYFDRTTISFWWWHQNKFLDSDYINEIFASTFCFTHSYKQLRIHWTM